jgi:Protein of unknown function (DUF3300)
MDPSPEETMLGWTVRIARRGLAAGLACITLSGIALTQDMVVPSPNRAVTAPSAAAAPAPTAPAVPAPGAPATTPAAPRLNEAQLEQLVAPIALSPDPLLAQILMASTYPLEVVEAARWVATPAIRALSGDALESAIAAQNWDPSVKALAAFPPVLETMSNELRWTEALGNAFLIQQGDVMAAVQSLRHAALAAGTLKTTPQCDCVVRTNGSTISILPAEPEDIRAPVYGPVVYGPWPNPAYPPDDFPAPEGFDTLPGFSIDFEPPVDLAFFGPLWGWGWIDWEHRCIGVEPHRYALALGRPAVSSGRVWVHDPAHRGGVPYSDAAVRARFDGARVAALTMAARAVTGDAVTVLRPGDAGHFAALRNAATHDWADRIGVATVLRGVAPHTASGFRGRAEFRAGPTEFRGVPGFRVGIAHAAVVGPRVAGGSVGHLR